MKELCLRRVVCSLSVFLALGLRGVFGSSYVDQHLIMGKKLLDAGQGADALSYYHDAVEGDPSNYLTYYERALAYISLGKSRSALPDLTKAIELRPGFTAGLLKRANVLLKRGNLADAEKDYNKVLIEEPGNVLALEKLYNLKMVIAEKEGAKQLYDNHEFKEAIVLLKGPIKSCPWDADLMELRAASYEAIGDLFKAALDIKATTKLRNDNRAAYFKLSKLYYLRGDANESLIEIRECLKLDPDHKECSAHYKKVKKLLKQMQSVEENVNKQAWNECVEQAHHMMETEGEVWNYVSKAKGHLCRCQLKAGKAAEAVESCKQVLEMKDSWVYLVPDESDVEAICDLAEAYVANKQYEEAIKEYQRAQKIGSDSQRVESGLSEVRKFQKQSQKAMCDVIAEKICDLAEAYFSNKQYEEAVNEYLIAQTKCSDSQRVQAGLDRVQKLLKLCPNKALCDIVEKICDVAEAYIANKQYEDAIAEYQKAQSVGGVVQDDINRAQTLLKQSQKRDYYEVLGVERNASEKEIMEKYKIKNVQWDPQIYEGKDKKMAEKMIMDIASAMEVLSDPEMRQKYDNGEDPLDPEQQPDSSSFNEIFIALFTTVSITIAVRVSC